MNIDLIDLKIDFAFKLIFGREEDWEAASADPQFRELYFDRKKAILDELAAVEVSKLNAVRAEAKGKAEGMAETICRFLEARFGVESQALQGIVCDITDLDGLGGITNKIFVVTHLDEAKALIQGNLVSQ